MNQKYMDLAFQYAEKAFDNDEVPIGAVIVKDNEVISYGFNQKETNQSVLQHAELIAIEGAEKIINNWRLDDCEMYVTLDPCPMCASAIQQSRIKTVYSALSNNEDNSILIQKIFLKDSTNPETKFYTNFDSERSKKLLNSFFKKQRNK